MRHVLSVEMPRNVACGTDMGLHRFSLRSPNECLSRFLSLGIGCRSCDWALTRPNLVPVMSDGPKVTTPMALAKIQRLN